MRFCFVPMWKLGMRRTGKIHGLICGSALPGIVHRNMQGMLLRRCHIVYGAFWYRAQEYAGHAGFTKRTPIRKVNCGKELNSYIDGILEAHQLSYTDELKRNGYLMLFFATLMEDYKKIVPAIANQHSYPGSVYVKHAMEYIAYHYREKIKINELADYIGVNRSYLTSSFKKAIGCSPQEYLVNLRMEKARDMLRNTGMQINAVAAAVGYQDQLAFSKIFKQHFGTSPKAYREMGEELQLVSEKGKYTAKKT